MFWRIFVVGEYGPNTCLSIWHVHLVSSTTISSCYVHSCVFKSLLFCIIGFCALFERHMFFCASHIYCAWWFLCSDSSVKVSPDSIWDLGSLTKVTILPSSQPLVVKESHQGLFIRFRIAFIILASLQKYQLCHHRNCKYKRNHLNMLFDMPSEVPTSHASFEQNTEFAQNL